MYEIIKREHIVGIPSASITVVWRSDEVEIAQEKPIFTHRDVKIEKPPSKQRPIWIIAWAIYVY